MPITTNRTVIVTTDGKDLLLTQRDQVRTQTDIVFECDSSRCEARHDGRVKFTWQEEAAQKNIDALPSEYFQAIRILPDPTDAEKAIFVCSPQCGKDYLTYDYVPPKSKEEHKDKFKVTAEAQAAIDAQMKLPFPEEA